jgi:hypothetical protein
MQIDWISFTPIPSLLGGVILGVAAALYVLLHGRILGVSGIVSGLLHPTLTDSAWRVSLVLGIISSPFLAALFFWNISCYRNRFRLDCNCGCWSSRWFRCSLWIRLYKWPRYLWTIPFITSIPYCHPFFYGRRFSDCIYSSPLDWRLR